MACQGFKDGYNKANEWHYPSKGELPTDVDGLPDSLRKVEVFTKDRDIFIAVIDADGEEWYTGRFFSKVLSMDQVIAWRETIFPEIKE